MKVFYDAIEYRNTLSCPSEYARGHRVTFRMALVVTLGKCDSEDDLEFDILKIVKENTKCKSL